MRKINLAVLLASGLMAADSGFYVGVDIGVTAFSGSFTGSVYTTRTPFRTTSISGEVSDDIGSSQTLKAGYYLDKNNRVSAFYQNIVVDNGDGKMFGVKYDYLFGDDAFKPFIGATLGHASISSSADVIGLSADISGAVYGVQAGALYEFSDNFSAEIGYKYMIASMEDTISGTYKTVSYNINMQYDNIRNVYVGVNYKF